MERCIDDELLFEIPDSWEWVRLGTVLEIARGGSPRPIQQYLTTEPDGINWIKIGDTDKGGKYIYKTKEKIRPEGVAKSRMVHSGNFLLTNSVSDAPIFSNLTVVSTTVGSFCRIDLNATLWISYITFFLRRLRTTSSVIASVVLW